jgi:hypothetical protein
VIEMELDILTIKWYQYHCVVSCIHAAANRIKFKHFLVHSKNLKIF